jgi:lipopolysaccharide transport system permease protein
MISKSETIITPNTSLALEWREFLDNKELLRYFVWRNFKIRYKQTVVGAAWAIFKPLILMVVFTFAFNSIGSVESGSDDVPYTIFAYAGLMFWTYFSQTVNQVGNSFVTFQNMIKKIYFPRLIIPVSIMFTGFIDFLFSLIVYVGLMIYYGIAPSALGVILFIPMILLTMLSILGIGMFAAALNVRYRDVTQVLPFLIQAMLFLTPVVYPVSAIPEEWQWVLYLNPMTGVVDTAQITLLGLGEISWNMLAISVVSAVIIFIISLRFFKAKEREFADLI